MTVNKWSWSVSKVWSLMADLARRKVGPLKKEREAEVNGGGVQRIGGGLEFKAECSIGVEPAGLLDEDLGEIGKDAPGPFFVGHRQGVTGGGLPDAGLIEFRAKGRQTGFDVAQTFAPSQLGEGGAIIVHQVKNRSNAGSHPQGIVAELKSKKLKQ